jgi:hypothetical protein
MPEPELDVGAAGGGIGVPEAPSLEEGGGDGAFAGQEVLQARQRRPMRLGVAVIGVGAGAFGDDEEVKVVLQVRADLWAVEDDRDAEAAQVVGGADAGKLEEAGGADGAGGENDLGRGAERGFDCLDADRPTLFGDDAKDLLAGFHGQVGAV